MTLSLTWTLLVLLAAVMHAGWNVLVKFGLPTAGGGDGALSLTWTLLDACRLERAVSATMRSSTATLIMGMAGLIALAFVPFVDFPDRPSWIFLVGSLATHVGYYIFLLLGYRHGNLSLVYPTARGSAPLLVAITSWLFVGEALSTTEMAGVAAISIGIFSPARGSRR